MAIGRKVVHKNGKTYTYARDYKAEYKDRTPQQKANREKRRDARTKMEKALGAAALHGKDVDHIHGIGGGNGRSNLRVQSPKANRSRKSKLWR